MNREQLINFIKNNDQFYEFVDFRGHTYQQILDIYEKVMQKIKNSQCDGLCSDGSMKQNK